MLANLVQVPAFAESWQRRIDQKQADPFGSGFGIGFGGDDHHIGVLAVGDEGLGAIEDVVVAVFYSAGAHGLQVAAGARLGHGDGAHRLT